MKPQKVKFMHLSVILGDCGSQAQWTSASQWKRKSKCFHLKRTPVLCDLNWKRNVWADERLLTFVAESIDHAPGNVTSGSSANPE